jgi:hypothetical protein
MNKSTILMLAALCLMPRSVEAQSERSTRSPEEGAIGRGVICDTAQHVLRFVALRGGGEDPNSAIETVNLEAHDEEACHYAFVAYTDEKPIARMAVNLRVFNILQITVHAVGDGSAWMPIPPTVQYTVTVEKGLMV